MPSPMVSPIPDTTVDALASFRSEIDAMNDSDIVTPRVDVAAAALTAIGAMPEIEAQRAAIVAVFGEAGGLTLDRLVPVARAVLLAHSTLVATAERDLEPMARELMDVRNALYNAASALMERELVSKKELHSLVGGQSYQGRVVDTMGLASWFRALPSAVRAQTKVDDAQLRQAEQMAHHFSEAFAKRDQASAGSSKPARDRARMFSLFFRTYERVRRMLGFVRWHEADRDAIAPSIFAGRSSRRNDHDVVAPADPTNDISPDMPGADPFRA